MFFHKIYRLQVIYTEDGFSTKSMAGYEADRRKSPSDCKILHTLVISKQIRQTILRVLYFAALLGCRRFLKRAVMIM